MVEMSAPQGPPLIGALMRMPVDAVRRRLIDGLHGAGFDDVVPAHLAVMRYPGPQGRRPSDLAADTGMTKQAMNYLLGQLEEFGYLIRTDDPDDGRSKRVELTERGYAAMTAMRAAMAELEHDLERELGREDFRQLKELLIRVNTSSLVQDGVTPSAGTA